MWFSSVLPPRRPRPKPRQSVDTPSMPASAQRVSSAPPVEDSPEVSFTPDDDVEDDDEDGELVTTRVGPLEDCGAVEPPPPPAGAVCDCDTGGGGGGGSWGGAPVSIASADPAPRTTAKTTAAAGTTRFTPARLRCMVGRVLPRARTASHARRVAGFGVAPTARKSTLPRTQSPPRTARRPGISPVTSATQTGF